MRDPPTPQRRRSPGPPFRESVSSRAGGVALDGRRDDDAQPAATSFTGSAGYGESADTAASGMPTAVARSCTRTCPPNCDTAMSGA